jgi:hypothetical protein
MTHVPTLSKAKHSRTMAGIMLNETAYTYTNIKKEKKMGWLKRKFAEWSREVWENSRSEQTLVRGADTPSPKTSVRFAIYPASGGWIIEHSKSDLYKDNDGPTLTIITDFDDLGKTVEHIITLEALRS